MGLCCASRMRSPSPYKLPDAVGEGMVRLEVRMGGRGLERKSGAGAPHSI
jgi:hypothetical protein